MIAFGWSARNSFRVARFSFSFSSKWSEKLMMGMYNSEFGKHFLAWFIMFLNSGNDVVPVLDFLLFMPILIIILSGFSVCSQFFRILLIW